MGELPISVLVKGKPQSLDEVARLCENQNCKRGPKRSRRYFVPKRQNHKYCCRECNDSWNNKVGN